MTSEKYTPQEIARLILLVSQGKAGQEQIDRLEDWLEECEANRQFYEKMKSRAYLEIGLEGYMRYNSREDWKKLREKAGHKRRIPMLRLLPYAAVVVLTIGIVGVWKYKNRVSDSRPVVQARAIEPGAPRALLILANGQKIDLELQ